MNTSNSPSHMLAAMVVKFREDWRREREKRKEGGEGVELGEDSR